MDRGFMVSKRNNLEAASWQVGTGIIIALNSCKWDINPATRVIYHSNQFENSINQFDCEGL